LKGGEIIINETLFSIECERCGAKCKVNPKPGSNAKMLKRGSQAKGFCINCAVHDWLRNTYPANLLLATLSPDVFRLEHIQQQFIGIMRAGNADANPDEINWEAVITNWDLPFKTKVKAGATNPCSQEDLDREPAERAKREAMFKEGLKPPTICGEQMTITSLEQLNELEPGLGDELKRCLG